MSEVQNEVTNAKDYMVDCFTNCPEISEKFIQDPSKEAERIAQLVIGEEHLPEEVIKCLHQKKSSLQSEVHKLKEELSSLYSSTNKRMEYNSSNMLECVRSFIPQMTSQMYKGQCGRIGVVGGCKEYTGAPYFSAISVLKVGADLSHVFCTEAAAPVIKSYSPELIVHPILDGPNCLTEIDQWLQKLHALVIGPGLGRDQAIFENLKGIIQNAKKIDLPLVIDADGVYFLTQDPDLIKGYRKAILTPNGIEFIRLYEKVMGKTPNKDLASNNTKELAEKLNAVTIVCKGKDDVISDGINVLLCKNQGSARRCGGQGDLLSGSMGTFTYWAHKAVNSCNDKANQTILHHLGPNICGAYAACFLTRECNRLAFCVNKRSMTTSDMIACIGQAFDSHFETD